MYKYVDTCLSVKECIKKGYLGYEPSGFPATYKEYRVVILHSTYIVTKKIKG